MKRAFHTKILPDQGKYIRGSRFVRSYCTSCGEPIRVVVVTEDDLCWQCDPDHETPVGNDPCHEHWEEVRGPWQENAMRALEG